MKIALPMYVGIGDHLVTSVMMRNLANEGHELHVISRHAEIYKNNPNITSLWYEKDKQAYLEDVISSCDKLLFNNVTGNGLYRHLTEHVSKCWCNQYGTTFDNIYPDYYITPEEDKRGYEFVKQFSKPTLIFQPTCGQNNSPDGRQRWWNQSHAQRFVDEMEKHFDILHLRLPDEPTLNTKYTLPKLSFREVISILKHVDSFLSVHSSIQHASAIFKKQGVVLFGLNTPDIWGYPHNTNLMIKSSCPQQPCNRPEIFAGDKWKCPNPICMDHPVEMVIDELRKIIKF